MKKRCAYFVLQVGIIVEVVGKAFKDDVWQSERIEPIIFISIGCSPGYSGKTHQMDFVRTSWDFSRSLRSVRNDNAQVKTNYTDISKDHSDNTVISKERRD